MKETVIEQSERLDGMVVQTVQRSDGTEFSRECPYECSICGAFSHRKFIRGAIGCMRDECEL